MTVIDLKTKKPKQTSAYSVVIRPKNGKAFTYLRTIDLKLAEEICKTWLEGQRSVTVIDSTTRRSITRFIYGRRQ